MTREDLEFIHRYVPGTPAASQTSRVVLFLLHGTGGDENDLIPLGANLLPGAAMLSPRGKVLEGNAPRFFRRIAEGVFDQADLARRTDELARFVEAAIRAYGLDGDNVYAVGFSNGANIAGSLLLRRPGLLRGAVLWSPMVPFEPDALPDLTDTRVFIGAGRTDRIAPPDHAERLTALLRRAGADVTLHWHPGGHTLSQSELEAARAWIAGRVGASTHS
jgi:phospholipase/carboxylesterase